MIELNTAWQFAAALGLGMLIGLERERTRGEERTFAGVRTFSLVALLGATAVYAGERSELTWIVGLDFLAVMELVVTAYKVTSKNGSIGATTEFSLLITFFIGGLCAWGEVAVAGAVAVIVRGGEVVRQEAVDDHLAAVRAHVDGRAAPGRHLVARRAPDLLARVGVEGRQEGVVRPRRTERLAQQDEAAPGRLDLAARRQEGGAVGQAQPALDATGLEEEQPGALFVRGDRTDGTDRRAGDAEGALLRVHADLAERRGGGQFHLRGRVRRLGRQVVDRQEQDLALVARAACVEADADLALIIERGGEGPATCSAMPRPMGM